MTQAPKPSVWELPPRQVARPWQFSLKSLFLTVGLSGFPLVLVSPSFFATWNEHASILDPSDRQLIVAIYAILLAIVPAGLFCYAADVLGNAGSRASWGDRAGKAPYSHRFVIDYTITAIATPLLFVLTPLEFVRAPRTALILFSCVFAIVTVVSGIRKWQRRRAAANPDTRDIATSKQKSAGASLRKFSSSEINRERSIDLRYQVRGDDLVAASRFLNPMRMRYAIASLFLLMSLAIVIGSGPWAALVCAGLWAACVLVLRRRQAKRRSLFCEVRISISASGFVTSQGDSTRFLTWDQLTSYGATRNHLFVFLNSVGSNGKAQRQVIIMPRRELTPARQIEVEAILENKLGAGAETIRQRRRRQFLPEFVILLVLLLFSALIHVP